MDFEAGELTLRMDSEQEKFKIYSTIEKLSHKENSGQVNDEETKDHLKCQHLKEVGGIIGNLKDEK